MSSTARPSLRLLSTLLGALTILALLLPVTAPPAEATTRAEAELVRLVNVERAKAGKSALRVNADLAKVARSWSGRMASTGRLHHRPDLASAVSNRVTTRWTRIGENVGYSRSTGLSDVELARRVHRNLMASPSHRRNILGDYNRVGIGVVLDKRGTLWVTENFLKVR